MLDGGDAEETAYRELSRRARRIRMLVLVPAIVVGLASGLTGYVLFRVWQLEVNGVHAPVLTGAVGFAAPFLGILQISWILSKRLIRWRTPSWVDELSAYYKVPRERLVEVAALWG
jgi:hypothetical protein